MVWHSRTAWHLPAHRLHLRVLLLSRLWCPLQLLACTVLLRLHPKPLVHTPSYEFTASFFGVCWGLIIGLSRCGIPCQTEYRPGASLQLLSTLPGWLLVLKRTLLGVLCCQVPFS